MKSKQNLKIPVTSSQLSPADIMLKRDRVPICDYKEHISYTYESINSC